MQPTFDAVLEILAKYPQFPNKDDILDHTLITLPDGSVQAAGPWMYQDIIQTLHPEYSKGLYKSQATLKLDFKKHTIEATITNQDTAKDHKKTSTSLDKQLTLSVEWQKIKNTRKYHKFDAVDIDDNSALIVAEDITHTPKNVAWKARRLDADTYEATITLPPIPLHELSIHQQRGYAQRLYLEARNLTKHTPHSK